MLKLDRIYQVVNGNTVELSLADWMEASGLLVKSYYCVYHINRAIAPGDTMEIPSKVYDSTRDTIIVNQEGFVLIPGFQYTENGNIITFNIDIPENTEIHIIIIKLHGQLDYNGGGLMYPDKLPGAEVITTENGNLVYRHIDNNGSVLQLKEPLANGVKKILVFDTKFITTKKWWNGSDYIQDISCLSNLTDSNGISKDKTASKSNTDCLMLYEKTDAAHHCRSVGADLPTMSEMLEIYKAREAIYNLDQTKNINTNVNLSEWKFDKSQSNGVPYCWSSSEHNNNHAWCVKSDGTNYVSKNAPIGVVPILELD